MRARARALRDEHGLGGALERRLRALGACAQVLGHFQYRSPGPVTKDQVGLDLEANAAGRARDHVRVLRIDAAGQLSVVIGAKSTPDVAPGQSGHPGARIACGDLEART